MLAGRGEPSDELRAALVQARALEAAGRYTEALAIAVPAAEAARQAGDRAGSAHGLLAVAELQEQAGDYRGAERPDLVISGMNLGQNVGRAVNHSGTVGAAVTAEEEGVPSIAVSIGLNFQDVGTGFSQTSAAAPHAAAYVKTLIDQLRATARNGEGLLPDRVALNLNYPVLLGEDGLFDPALVQEPRVTVVGHGEVVHPQYLPIPNNPGVYFSAGSICGLQVPCDPETVDDADTTALAEGAISITPLAVDGAVNPQLGAQIQSRLLR